MRHVDDLYYFCLARLRLNTLAYQRGESSLQSVDALGTAVMIEIRKLYDCNLLTLLQLPQA